MASAASDGGAEPQADQQADPQADPQADQQADNTAMPTQGQPLRHHSQPPQSAIPSPPTGSSTPSSPQLTAAPAGAATGHHQGHTQAHHPAYAQVPAQQHALDNTATAPAASAAVHHHHPTHARAPAQEYVPDSATTSPSAPQPYLPADAEAPTTLEQSVSRHPPALNSARSAVQSSKLNASSLVPCGASCIQLHSHALVSRASAAVAFGQHL